MYYYVTGMSRMHLSVRNNNATTERNDRNQYRAFDYRLILGKHDRKTRRYGVHRLAGEPERMSRPNLGVPERH